jgi:hypothetical protein
MSQHDDPVMGRAIAAVPIIEAVGPHTGWAGKSLVHDYLTAGKAMALVFTEAQEIAARSVGLEVVYVHDGRAG